MDSLFSTTQSKYLTPVHNLGPITLKWSKISCFLIPLSFLSCYLLFLKLLLELLKDAPLISNFKSFPKTHLK